jgi:hypothetical protein
MHQYLGDVLYFQLPGLGIMVLSSLEDAEELLVKRANVWSGRVDNFMMNQLYVPWFSHRKLDSVKVP